MLCDGPEPEAGRDHSFKEAGSERRGYRNRRYNETNIISVHTHMDQEEVGNLFRRYDLLAMPVVDQENRLVGIITIDDIIDIIEYEKTRGLSGHGGYGTV